ncbi:MAG: GNAT family N-acetyltransferase [Cyanobacteria bacterium J06627_8]
MDCSHVQFHIHDPQCLHYQQHEHSRDYTHGSDRPIDYDQLLNLFHVAAFWASDRSLEDIKTAVVNSRPVVTLWDGDRLIGFARATSDGVFRATIWDVVVHPTYQGLGLGRKLVQTVLMHPHVNRAERVYLMTTNQQEFYKRIGFQENSTTTMVLFNQFEEPLPFLISQSETQSQMDR